MNRIKILHPISLKLFSSIMLIGAMIGLGALSLGYSLYRQRKSDSQVDTANANNRYAAELSYKAQQETNAMNYDIFQQQLQYNSPANLKSMYDALGLNGSAIVANQGFTPTAAPAMQAPQLDQTPYLQYDNSTGLGGADRMMKSLLDGLATEKVQAEIEEIGKRTIKTEAETAQCQQATENLILDYVFKQHQIKGAELENILKSNDVQMLNESNAQLRLSVRRLEQTIDSNDKLMPYILRQYDDKHAMDAAETVIKELDAKYHEQEIKLSLKKMFADIQTAIKTHRMMDIEYTMATYSEEIARLTKHSTIESTIAENTSRVASANTRRLETLQDRKVLDLLDYENADDAAEYYLGKFLNGFNVLLSAFLTPLQGLVKSLGKM